MRPAVALCALTVMLTGCAAPMGQVAGTVAGNAAKFAWVGGKFAVKTTGRTVIGAAKGIHEEFSPKGERAPARSTARDDRDDRVGDLSQGQGATLPY